MKKPGIILLKKDWEASKDDRKRRIEGQKTKDRREENERQKGNSSGILVE